MMRWDFCRAIVTEQMAYSRRLIASLATAALLLCSAAIAAPTEKKGAPNSKPAAKTIRDEPPPSSPSPTPAPAAPSYRFDALRFGGELSGPHALLTRGKAARRRGALLSLKRTFVHRIFETIEAPALHR